MALTLGTSLARRAPKRPALLTTERLRFLESSDRIISDLGILPSWTTHVEWARIGQLFPSLRDRRCRATCYRCGPEPNYVKRGIRPQMAFIRIKRQAVMRT